MTPGPRTRAHGLAVLITLVVWANAGCSFTFVDGPPAQHQTMPYFECSSGRGWPIVDGIIGASVAIGAASDLERAGTDGGRADAVIGAAEAALFLASAAYGLSKTSACREAKEALLLRLQDRERADPPPDPWAPPPLRPAPRSSAPDDPWAAGSGKETP
jgi:hypothetical protein